MHDLEKYFFHDDIFNWLLLNIYGWTYHLLIWRLGASFRSYDKKSYHTTSDKTCKPQKEMINAKFN